MRVSAFRSDAILRVVGTGLRRTKSPGGAAFEPCSIAFVESFGRHGTSEEHCNRSLGRSAEFFDDNIASGSPGEMMSSAGMT